jgi:S-phase kinase-associated protein 1
MSETYSIVDTTTVALQSGDDKTFIVDTNTAKLSKTVSDLLEDIGHLGQAIPLPNVEGEVLAKVIEYCKYHTTEEPRFETQPKKDKYDCSNILPWDLEFTKGGIKDLAPLYLAANYMDVAPLVDTMAKAIANLVKGKTPEEIRANFNITRDFTAEEEKQLLVDNEWVDEQETAKK